MVEPPPKSPPLEIFGDSITCGAGASDFSKSWVGLWTPAPRYGAANGAQAADLATMLLGVAPDAGRQYAVMIGSNDLPGKFRLDDPARQRLTEEDPARQRLFKAFLLQSLVHLVTGRKGGEISYTGAWTDVNAGALRIGRTAKTHGAAATARVSGTAVYIGYFARQGGSGTADVVIDGVKAGALTSSGDMLAMNGRELVPAAARFGGLGDGPHTVEVIITSADGPNFFLGHIAGSALPATPKILLSNIIRMRADAYLKISSGDGIVDQYNAIIAGLAAELTADGFDIRLVDNHAAIDPAADLGPDGVHPNDAGHGKIHCAFRSFL